MQSDQWTEGNFYNITCRVPDWQAFCIRPRARVLFSPKLSLLSTAEDGRDVFCGSCFRSSAEWVDHNRVDVAVRAMYLIPVELRATIPSCGTQDSPPRYWLRSPPRCLHWTRLPRSLQRSRYWLARANKASDNLQYGDPVPGWAKDTAGDCDPSNPTHANAQQAFIQGRVAFQVWEAPLAACWMQVSAAQEHLRAKIYVALFYLLGLGVKQDLPRGFSSMEALAYTKDGFANMHLAGFYRYGIGTSRNDTPVNFLERMVLQNV